ncbi:Fc.00g002620.m01.CDS01 [Cosmosporella sp. VM-42]
MSLLWRVVAPAIVSLASFQLATAQSGLLPACADDCSASLNDSSVCDISDFKCICRKDVWKDVMCCVVAACDDSDARNAILIGEGYCKGLQVSVDTNTKGCSAASASDDSGDEIWTLSSTEAPSTASEDTTVTDEATITEEDGSIATEPGTTLETSIRQKDSSSGSPVPTAGSTSNDGSNSGSDSGQGSNTTPIGIGVGLGVGIPLALGVFGWLAFSFWKTKRQSPKTTAPVGQGGDNSPGNVQAGVAVAVEKGYDGVVKVASSPGHESAYVPPTNTVLPAREQRHELGYNMPLTTHELGYTPTPRHELSGEERQRQLDELP